MGAKNYRQLELEATQKVPPITEQGPQPEPLNLHHAAPTQQVDQEQDTKASNQRDQQLHQLNDALQTLRGLAQDQPTTCKACVFEDNTMPYIRVAFWVALVIVALSLAYFYIKTASQIGLPRPV